MNAKKGGYLKATGLYTIGSMFNKAISLLLLPVFTRLLSKSSYGIVSTYTSWVNIVVIIVGVQLNLSLRSASVDYKDEIDSYTHSLNVLTSLISAVLMAITIVVCSFTLETTITLLVFFCFIQSFMTAIINIELQKQMMELAYVKRTILLSLPNLLAALLGIAIIILFPETDYWGRIISMVFVYLLIGSIILIKYFYKSHGSKVTKYWKYALSFSIPLIFHGLANVLLNNIDRTMITAYRSAEETGVYSVAYTMGMVLIAVTSALESVWIPWFTKAMNEERKDEVNRIGKIYIFVGSFICTIAIMCMPEVLKLFTEKSYWDAVDVLPPIMLASYVVFLFTICANTEYYYKKTKHIAFNTLIAAGSNIVLNFILIPRFGAVAAAYTTLASYTLSFILHYLYSSKLNKDILQIKIYIIPTIVVIIGTILTYCCMSIPLLRWSIAIVSVILALIFVASKRDTIMSIF